MIKINLLVEEEYIDTFMTTLPQDKVIVIEENFEQNRELLKNELSKCTQNSDDLLSYTDSIKELDRWLEKKSK
ncbi:MAG: hypothetical protein U9P38_08255 [Campylobacterota bacterium]|nr:hypothetical protein [Campylobacterota bacterium]